MTEQTPAPAAEAKPAPDPVAERHKLCLMLYGIFAVSLVLQFINLWTTIIGSAAIIAGIVICYMERKKSYGSLHGNHIQWLIRTFWIGSAVYLPIVTLIGFIAIMCVIDYAPMAEAFSTGEGNMQTAMKALLTQNSQKIIITLVICTAPFALWWWWRCWYGFKRLKAGKPIPNPMSWF